MRIAIVNDVGLAVEAMRRVIASVPGYSVVWTAGDGAEAARKCAADRPDMILMDLMMPVMDGVEATKRIMAQSPCAILIVTSTVSGHISLVFDAMGCGALDVVATPILSSPTRADGADAFLAKIATVGKLLSRSPADPKPLSPRVSKSSRIAKPCPLVAIGSSTGGPQALSTVLSTLPASFPAAIVIVQHVDIQFAAGMADWLAGFTKLEVCVAETCSALTPGVVYLAATNDHLVLTPECRLEYAVEPTELAFRPSVDVFFESAARNWKGSHLGVLLTGMGSDGAKGLLTLRQTGWSTIAQSRDTCIVYGMPKAAAELGAASEVLPLERIGPRIGAWAQRFGGPLVS